jgi:hypothetical protein
VVFAVHLDLARPHEASAATTDLQARAGGVQAPLHAGAPLLGRSHPCGRSRRAGRRSPDRSATPRRAAPRATCAARALATIVFVGVQPTLTQVPPSGPRSHSKTLRPASANRAASGTPAWPLPMTITS